jgi:hypothetical protein
MRPATDRVADREKQAAASRPPLKLRRACWRSFPEPQEELILKHFFGESGGTLSAATGRSSRRASELKRNADAADERLCDAGPQGVVPLLSEGRLPGRPSSFPGL